jgi:three-Cys-motif partner protein
VSDEPRVVEDDGRYTPVIKRHSIEKIRLHNRYASIFTTAMRAKWSQLAYIGLYAGAGRASVAGTGQIVETSALAVLRQTTPFTHYIFVDNDPACCNALERRCRAIAPNGNLTFITNDVNDCVPAVLRALPPYSKDNGLLSFCFVDPFDTTLAFSTIRGLSGLRIDFLILLMLGFDGRLNFRRYFDDPTSTRLAELIDCPHWRKEYRSDGHPLRFLLRKFDEAMHRAGYPRSTRDDVVPVYAHGMHVLLYNLVFYSKSPAGATLWRNTLASLARLRMQTSMFDF